MYVRSYDPYAIQYGARTVNPDGTGDAPFPGYCCTSDGQAITYGPAWSPDGTRIAYNYDVVGGEDSYGGMESRNADGSDEQPECPSGSSGSLAWSLDGRWIAGPGYLDAGTNKQSIMRCDRNQRTWPGYEIRLTSGSANDTQPDWSPDGKRITFTSDRDGNQEIYVMNALDGSGVTRLTTDAANDYEPSWSPDGTKIAFVSERVSPSPEIFVMNSDGTGLTQLTFETDPEFPTSNTYPVWSPDGKKIAWLSTTNGIEVMNANGTGATAIGVYGYELDWQPIVHDHPQAASTLRVALVPSLRQTISTAQCQARGGQPSTHGSPLALPSCDPPGYVPGTIARMGPASTGSVDLTVVPGDLLTAADEADVAVVVNATDIRNRQTGSDYGPSPSAPDVTLTPAMRISDTYNGSPAITPATTSDFVFPVPVTCAATADPAVGSTCSSTSSFDAITPGAIKEGHKTSITTWRLWLYDSGSNGVRGDADDRQFAQQGIYVP